MQGFNPLHPTLFGSLLFSPVSMLLKDVVYHFVEFKTCDAFVLLSLIICPPTNPQPPTPNPNPQPPTPTPNKNICVYSWKKSCRRPWVWSIVNVIMIAACHQSVWCVYKYECRQDNQAFCGEFWQVIMGILFTLWTS